MATSTSSTGGRYDGLGLLCPHWGSCNPPRVGDGAPGRGPPSPKQLSVLPLRPSQNRIDPAINLSIYPLINRDSIYHESMLCRRLRRAERGAGRGEQAHAATDQDERGGGPRAAGRGVDRAPKNGGGGGPSAKLRALCALAAAIGSGAGRVLILNMRGLELPTDPLAGGTPAASISGVPPPSPHPQTTC
eukprot:gene16387-biopygen9314